MLKTEKDKMICEKLSYHDENGKVHCDECPLTMYDPDRDGLLMCKAIAHYDIKIRKWVYD